MWLDLAPIDYLTLPVRLGRPEEEKSVENEVFLGFYGGLLRKYSVKIDWNKGGLFTKERL
jgi:hypothetical protein